MNQKGMTLVEVLITITIISLTMVVYVQFTSLMGKEQKDISENITMESILIDNLEKEIKEYKNGMLKENKEEKKYKVQYGSTNYEIEVIAQNSNNKVLWKTDKNNLVKLKVRVKAGKKELEVETYVTEGKE